MRMEPLSWLLLDRIMCPKHQQTERAQGSTLGASPAHGAAELAAELAAPASNHAPRSPADKACTGTLGAARAHGAAELAAELAAPASVHVPAGPPSQGLDGDAPRALSGQRLGPLVVLRLHHQAQVSLQPRAAGVSGPGNRDRFGSASAPPPGFMRQGGYSGALLPKTWPALVPEMPHQQYGPRSGYSKWLSSLCFVFALAGCAALPALRVWQAGSVVLALPAPGRA